MANDDAHIDKVVLTQEGNTSTHDGIDEVLKVRHVWAPTGEPRGPDNTFYIIKTKCWAFDNIDELIETLVKAGVPRHG